MQHLRHAYLKQISERQIDMLGKEIDDLTLKFEKKVLQKIAKPSDISNDYKRIEKLYLCRSIDDILRNFPELSLEM